MTTSKQREKTYVFKRYREINASPDYYSGEELKNKLIEEELSKGYIPIHVKIDTSMTRGYDRATCISAFAGKKKARELYPKIKDVIVSNPTLIKN